MSGYGNYNVANEQVLAYSTLLRDSIKVGLTKSFSEVRHYFEVKYLRQVDHITEHGYPLILNEELAPLSNVDILNAWRASIAPVNNKAGLSEQPKLTPEEESYFLNLAQNEIAKHDHPYDKVGAILTVFKQYRAELYKRYKQPILTQHAVLRNQMTELLSKLSTSALLDNEEAVIKNGFAAVVQAADTHPTVAEFVSKKDLAPHEKFDKKSFFTLSADYYKQWKKDKNTIMALRKGLGDILIDTPKELVYLFTRTHGARFTQLAEYKRRPPPAFVLRHYLASSTKDSWDRSLFVSALIKLEKNTLRPTHMKEDNFNEYFKNLPEAPMDEHEFATLWKKVEYHAWKDYRKLRQYVVGSRDEHVLANFTEPSEQEKLYSIKKEPASVFLPPLDTLPLQAKKTLLDKTIPGLGSAYENLMVTSEAFDIAKPEVLAGFNSHVKELTIHGEKKVVANIDDLSLGSFI